jgi:ankyrin repeat protein
MLSDFFAALAGHDVDRVRSLLSQGADPNAPNADGWRPLHVVIGHLDVGRAVELVRVLLEHGAEVEAWDVDRNETPLLSASVPGGAAVARVLLEAGANANVRNRVGDSPLRQAVWARDRDLVELLLRHGATHTIDEYGGDFAWTPLGIAAHLFDVPIIELLLAAGADPQATDDFDRTARDHLPPREAHDPDTWDRVMELLGRRVADPEPSGGATPGRTG